MKSIQMIRGTMAALSRGAGAGALAALFIACVNPVSPPSPQAQGGTAQVRFAPDFGGSAQVSPEFRASPALRTGSERTIFPRAPELDGLFLEYTFAKGSIATAPTADPAGVYTLEIGEDWEVTAKAYFAEDLEQPVGESGATPFTVSDDAGVQTIPITLRPIENGGKGTIDYAISYPKGTLVALTLVKTGSGAALNLMSDYAEDDSTRTYKGTDMAADPGYYDLTVQLKDDLGRTAGKTDVVHVYRNMKTTIDAEDWTFTVDDFTALLVKAASVTGLVAPVTGATPADAGLPPGETRYGFAATGFIWQEQTGPDTWNTFSGDFKPRTTYRAAIALQAESGYKFSGSITPTVTDPDGTSLPDGSIVSVGTLSGDIAMNTLRFTVSFPETWGGTAAVDTSWDIPALPTLAITKSSDTDWISPTGTLNLSLGDSSYSDIQWTVNGSPVGTATTYSFKGSGRRLGTYTVGVQAKQSGGWYENRVKVSIVSLMIGSAYTKNYTVTLSSDQSIVKSITTAEGGEILIGRKVGEPITLKLSSNGNLQFRDAVRGSIPIGSYAEFQLISTASDGLEGAYRQEADLDLMGNAAEWTAVGADGDPFTGTFDGGGKAISNLYINNSLNDQGLFGSIGSDGMVKNVHIASGSVTGLQWVGGVVGSNYGAIIACSNSGAVTGTGNPVGGVAGINIGSITACSNSGAVTGVNSVGGVAGYNQFGAITVGDISACSNSGAVTGVDSVGGVVGYSESGAITACSNSGTVTGADSVGGVAGSNESGDITACSNTGAVSGRNKVGGVAGHLDGGVTVIACYNTGTVTGNGSVGGVVGRNWNTNVTACYNIGAVVSSGSNVGGVVGEQNSGRAIACYWTQRDDVPGSTANAGGGTRFAAVGAWPSADASSQWGTGAPAGANGHYWKSLGKWGTPPEYPKLW